MSKAVVCPNCGGSDIDNDQSRGNAVCVGCGSVIEDNFIVSEVGFSENSLGGTSVIGQFVSSEGNKSSSLGGTFRPGVGKESRLITLQKGKKRVQHIGNQLNLNNHCLDIAYNFFKMAVQKKLTRGRRTDHVVAACLYLVCRLECTPHMLLDFSDLLQVNVYFLGKTYMKLSQELHINVPAIDPCLYIQRFAHKLEFGDKTHIVSMVALRLVSRMKRDWMHTGRRPSGLCGAALLVAARLHNFRRTQRQIIKVVKVCDATLRKRLTEFEETPSGQLTIDEFNNIDLEEEQDPPAFTQARRKAKMIQLEELSKSNIKDLEGEVSTVQLAIEQALNKRSRLLEDTESVSSMSTIDEIERDLSLEEFEEEKSLHSAIKEVSGKHSTHTSDNQSSPSLKDFEQSSSSDSQSQSNRTSEVIPQSSCKGGDKKSSPDNYENYENNEIAKTRTEEDSSIVTESTELDQLLMPPPWVDAKKQQGIRPSPLSLGLKDTIEECMRVPSPKDTEDENESGELDLQGINDEELNWFILTENEVKLKTRLWDAENGEYYKQLKAKEAAEEKQREQNQAKNDQKKRKKYTKKPQTTASTAGEAIEKLLQEKKISSKINYDVLKNLEMSSSVDTKPPSSPRVSIIPAPPIIETEPLLTKQNKDTSLKRQAEEVPIKESPKKKIKDEVAKFMPLVGVQEPTPPSDVVIESGPVEQHAEETHDEEADDYYEEEEDDNAYGNEADNLDDYNDDYDADGYD